MPSPRAPPAAHATRCKVVVRKPGDFWGFFPAAQLRCAARGCGRRARKRHGGASTLQHPPRARRARSRAASARAGSRNMRATRRAQDQRSPLTVKPSPRSAHPPAHHRGRRRGLARSGLRGTGARNGPAKVAHPLALGVTGHLPGRRPRQAARHHALPLRLPSVGPWADGAAGHFCFRKNPPGRATPHRSF
jgi:hypothetical protein